MTKDVRYYRDLQPGETLQAGDMWRVANHSDAEWQTITADDIAKAPEGGFTVFSVEESGIEYRRPVDLPVLQRVTPEAMAELKQNETCFILFHHKEEPAFRFERAEYSKLVSLWLDADGYEINPFDWRWFIVPSTIPEVQQ